MILLAYAVAIILMVGLPIPLAVWMRRRQGVPWWLFCVGMATFVGSQVYHLPLNHMLEKWGVLASVSPDSPRLLQTAIILGLSAGLCESLARVVGYGLLFRFKKEHSPVERVDGAIIVGLGHGGIEAMILAVMVAASVVPLWQMRGQDLSALNLSPEQRTALEWQLAAFEAPLRAAMPVIERGIAILLHVVLSAMVWLAFQRRNIWYGVGAVLYHAAVDTLAVLMPQFISNVWAVEGLFLLLVAPGGVWLWWVWRRSRRDAADQGGMASMASWRVELGLFLVSLRKEMFQQWRTRRALVVGVVLVAFGMLSPLLAKLTPEMLRAIPGAEQFSDLVPTPTAADAVSQYIKNLTQFGFILAILLGMGAVAGEKERGIAAIILSKPLPRWAFLWSKLVTQAAVYGAALALAALGAWYYTYVLFEPLHLGAFLLGNVLLWLWLLTFAAVTLLGSTLASSTGAAAGMGFGGAVLLLILGSIPRYGALMPAGLVGWAGTLGLDVPAAVNGGALVSSVVWIIVCMVAAVAVFETQEL